MRHIDEPFLVSVGAHFDGQFYGCAFDLDDRDERAAVENLLGYVLVDHRMVLHNAKFDLRMLINAGLIDRENVSHLNFDNTHTMTHLIDPHLDGKLKVLAKKLLGMDTDEAEHLAAVRRKTVHPELGRKLNKDDGYHLLPRDVVIPYAIRDVEMTSALYHWALPQLQADEKLWTLYEMERKLELAFLDIEHYGMGIDMDYVDETMRELNTEKLLIEHRARDLSGNEDFNLNSPVQVRAVFEEQQYDLPNTQKENLLTIKDESEFARLLLRYRFITKRASGWFKSLRADSEDRHLCWVYHPNFKVNGTVTGRAASGKNEGD